jgi:hypothetical protein
MEVVATNLTVRVNGAVVLRATDIVDQEGVIGIQNETSTVEIRRIEIEPLPRG